MNSSLVSSRWLYDNLSDPDLIILDASQADNKSGIKATTNSVQIVGARVFDIKHNFSDLNSLFPNTLLPSDKFQEKCRALGINTSSKIVVYDNLGIYTSPRVWWMFKIMGFDNIAVLNGGLPDWMSQGYQIEPIRKFPLKQGNFKTVFNSSKVKTFNDIAKNIDTEAALVIDARSANRFNGVTPEPRKGLRSGHIPKSINLPYTEVLSDGKYKSVLQLKTIFNEFNIENAPLIFSCGSGITACIVLLAADLVSLNKKTLYDGSWTEWAQLTQ